MKKFFALAMALMLVACMLPVVGAADEEPLTVYYAETAPTIDGVISEGEWGPAVYTRLPQKEDEEFEGAPDKVESFLRYDDESVYFAIRATGGTMKAGDFATDACYAMIRFDKNGDGNVDYYGLLSLQADGEIFRDNTMADGGTKVAVKIENGTAVFEGVITNRNDIDYVLQGAGTEFIARFDYATYINKKNDAGETVNAVQGFNTPVVNCKLAAKGEKPADTQTPADTTPPAPATFDAFVVAAAVVAASAAGVVVFKKRK